MSEGGWRNPRVWIGLIISLVAVVVLLYQVDLSEAREALRDANYIWLLPALVFSIGSLLGRALRWRVLLFPLQLPVGRMFSIMAIGYMVTTILPLRLGDFARAHLVGEIEEESKTRALTTIAVEHVMDALSVLVILLILSPLVALAGWIQGVMAGAAVLVLIAALIIGLSWFRRGKALSTLDAALQKLPESWASKIHDLVDAAIDGFSALASGKASLKVIGWSAAQWFAGILMMWAALHAFDLPTGFITAMLMVAMAAVALTIPSSPGFIGVYHVIITETLVLVFGARSGEAASFAVVSHLLLFVPPVIIGSLVILRDPGMWDRLLRWGRGEQGSSRDRAEPSQAAD